MLPLSYAVISTRLPMPSHARYSPQSTSTGSTYSSRAFSDRNLNKLSLLSASTNGAIRIGATTFYRVTISATACACLYLDRRHRPSLYGDSAEDAICASD